MKRYNLSPIMRNAHQLYKNARAKYPTFSDALKRSWKSAKFNVQVTESIKAMDAEKEAQKAKEQEEREQAQIRSILFTAELEAQRIKREAEAKAERMRDEIAARKQGLSYNEYQNQISRAMSYGCSHYCGDWDMDKQQLNNIYITADSLLSVKDLIAWLESRKSANVTIIIQSIGNITNSQLENVNTLKHWCHGRTDCSTR